MFERFTNEEKWITVLLPTEGEAQEGSNTLRPTRLKAEVLMNYERLPHFRVDKLNSTTTKCVTIM